MTWFGLSSTEDEMSGEGSKDSSWVGVLPTQPSAELAGEGLKDSNPEL